ncbi:hypothetical protein [Hellea balneolensis]|uniref:hypothetical protein n=1 Tax=Hellea balneolensis TaxID=287478 RepID=UPI0003FF99E0|nr:hypothetical protein [Hellea balneolensis]
MSKAEIKFPLKSETLLTTIDAWWAAFADYEGELNAAFTTGKEIEPSIVDFMAEIKKVSPDMCWEFSKGEHKPHRFTIAPERNYPLEPVAKLLKEQAPELEFFEIGVDRDATPWEWMQGEADSRFTWDSHENIYVSHTIGRQNFIDLTFYIPADKADAKQEANSFLLAELALGEKVVADWIGYVDVEVLKTTGLFKKKAAEPPANAYPIKDIRARIAAEIARFKNTLPKEPFRRRVEAMEWSIFKMTENDSQTNYLGDIYVASICDADLFSALYNGRSRFNSQRFSGLGESFVLVKINGASSNLGLNQLSSRSEIEDALTESFQAISSGAVVGGGMGQENAYIFLALEDEATDLDTVIDTLRTQKLGEKTWVFFCDSRRQCEWVGLWDDTPAPELSIR